jgi:PAS domain S-box-containing protein
VGKFNIFVFKSLLSTTFENGLTLLSKLKDQFRLIISNRINLYTGLIFLISISFGGFLIYFLEAKREFESRTIANSFATSHAQSLEKQLSRSMASAHELATVVKREFESRTIANNFATSYTQSLEKLISRSSSANGLKAAVKQNGTLSNFDMLAEEMIGHYGGITNLQLAPNGIIRQIFPLEGHQDAIGLDLNKNPYAIAAIRSKQLTVEGPVNLAQGEDAILGRYPVFLTNLKSGKEEFWGFATVSIELSQLLESVGIYGLISNNYLFELSRVDALTDEHIVFSKFSNNVLKDPEFELSRVDAPKGKHIVFSKFSKSVLKDPVSVDIEIPNGKWILSVVPKAGWHSSSYALLEGLIVLIFSGLLSFLSFRHLRKGNELQSQKNEYEIIFNSAPAFIIYKDRQNNILRVNQAVADSLNLKTVEIEGKHSKEIYPDHYEKYYSDDLEVIDSGKPKLGIIEPYQLKSGEMKWVQTNKVPYRDKNGNILGVLSFAVDITKQKEAETQALDYSTKLKKANKELEEFSAIASHDLQEPLRKIILFGDRAAAKISKKNIRGKDYLGRMQSAASRMQSLIDGILKYTRAKTKPDPFKTVNLNNMMKDVLVDLESRIHNSKGTVKTGDLPTIKADPVQMHQLFLNLVGNALKFHRKGVAPVIKVNTSQGGNGHHIITVEDNGIGIDDAHLERIFRPLERLHGRSEYEGTGMGLSICDKIVARHGGGITAKKNKRKGVTFIISLPKNN